MRIGYPAVIAILCAAGATAQEKVTVPITNPSQPVTLNATTFNGSIRVTAGTGRDLIVGTEEEARRRDRDRDRDRAPAGMKRIGGQPGLDIEEDHNVVTITTGMSSAHLVIEAPVNTNLHLKATNGPGIEVTGINGDHEIEDTNGSIHLTDVSGSVVAHTVNGQITASFARIDSNKPMSFTSLNGKIDVTLPADAKARLRLKSDNGAIYSDFDVKLDASASRPNIEDSRSSNGKYKISIDRSVNGTINGGGPEYTFQTMNGNILIHKK
jgi:DUF4097 and DUF4098 domain-containing protein YvlB